MANMSYCRFHNTKLDMIDCLNALDDYESISDEEIRHCVSMFRIITDYMIGEGLIEEVDEEAWKEWEEDLKERKEK